jgi:hypothetical protein
MAEIGGVRVRTWRTVLTVFPGLSCFSDSGASMQRWLGMVVSFPCQPFNDTGELIAPVLAEDCAVLTLDRVLATHAFKVNLLI